MAFINGTLVVQAINFSIAFYLIKYLFFKPVLAHITAEDSLQESLIASVQEHQSQVAAREHELKEHWLSVRRYFAENVPSLRSSSHASKRPDIVIPEFEVADVQRAAHQAADALVKKVDHVA